MSPFAASRRLGAVAAVLLLLFQSLLPSAHRWQHALERSDHRAAPALCDHHAGKGAPAGAVEDEGADVCSICIELMQVRDLLPELTVPPLFTSAPPCALPPLAEHGWLALPLPLPPPARGPPIS